ncbi:MAG: hypothetical protein WAV16_00135 [Candidatus Moraniibacteriota bacterium]
MDEKIENTTEKKSKKKRILILVILLLFFLLGSSFVWLKIRQEKNIANDVSEAEQAAVRDAENDEAKNEANEVGIDEALNVQAPEETAMVSENYRVSQVKFGGNAVIENGKSRDTKLEIYQVKSETIITQEENEPNILITWKTNKEAISNVDYSKSDGKNVISVTEEGYGFEHSMLLKNMEFSMIYTYRIESQDKWGNKVNTEYFSAYTGDKSESIFDLITNAIEDVFGWAM